MQAHYDLVNLSANNINSSSLRITSIKEKFPPSVFGGSNKNNLSKGRLMVVFPDNSSIFTDIDSTKNILRERGALRKFDNDYQLRAGDQVKITWINNVQIKLNPHKRH